MRLVTDAERRRRLAVRHGLHPDHRAAGPLEATRAMTVLHATEPSTVHLSVQARTEGVSIDDVEHALYRERSIVKQLAMRRTMFVAPRDLLPALWGSASARVAVAEYKRLAKEIESAGIADDGPAHLERAFAAVEAHLADGSAHQAAKLREALVELSGMVDRAVGKSYASRGSIAPNVLTLMGVQGRIVRGENAGGWRVSRPRWTSMQTWLGEVPAAWDSQAGYAEIVRRWLATFAPGTEADLVWWLGGTKAAVRQALADVGAVQVALGSGEVAWVLPDDVDERPGETAEAVGPWASLLPVLDPTTMGWRGRDWYLPREHVPYLFDTVGNGCTTVWVDGRIVGGWVQDEAGRVEVVLLEKVTADQRRLIDAQAARLTEWLEGQVVSNVYSSHVMKRLPLP
ncbi:winged helix DNA-binding domain-containing protein [Aestuariimicrobium ganziense]|uniref:winged helix DNA-binding domain-containing protein n=1 Tax=Aestuariimicrobium ganziense TaxID=2773677 RepID=UPI001943FC28|nr:winged helix DNA-binding domain-containing protein [Aestuariimicrobium ganziense]